MHLMMSYLSDLKANNNREWYHKNKSRLREAEAAFEQLLSRLIFSIGQADSSVLHNNPKDLTFKLVRDTRFSHDKSPYNPAFRAHIGPAGKLPVPCGYYISLSPDGGSFLGGGLFASMFRDATSMVRDCIAEHGEELEAIIKNEAFSAHFEIQGEALKKIPPGYDPNHPQAEFLKHKSWYLEYAIKNDALENEDRFIEQAAQVFLLMKPFNAYLNQALAGFQMPAR